MILPFLENSGTGCLDTGDVVSLFEAEQYYKAFLAFVGIGSGGSWHKSDPPKSDYSRGLVESASISRPQSVGSDDLLDSPGCFHLIQGISESPGVSVG